MEPGTTSQAEPMAAGPRADEGGSNEAAPRLSRRWRVAVLVVFLALAAGFRLISLDRVPPALHADEAPNAWNAYTLLKTGQDQYGVSWPVFYMRAFGDYRTTTYAYALIPFQFLGGMNAWTTRLPAALSGVASVLLIYWIGARLLGRATGLVAAGLLVANPWDLPLTRWGHEASLVPFLVLLGIAGLLWADLPIDDAPAHRPKILRAALAGALYGIGCYGYSAVRLFLPCFLVGMILVCWRSWWRLLGERRGRIAATLFAAGFGCFLLPLVWVHCTDPVINERAKILGWVWSESDSPAAMILKAAERYVDHFGPGFLFLRGDLDPGLSPPSGFGLLHWYYLPFLLVGVCTLLAKLRTSNAARVVLLWLLLYPIGDVLFPHQGSHSLRSAAGIGCMVLLAGCGAVQVWTWVWRNAGRRVAVTALVGAALVALASEAWFVRGYFGLQFALDKYAAMIFAADIFDAAEWLGPRISEADAVFITAEAVHPDLVSLVGLRYDPVRWFAEPRQLVKGPLPDGRYENAYIYLSYGKVHFLVTPTGRNALRALAANGRPDRVFFVLRPGELDLEQFGPPVHEVLGATGRARLLIFDLVL